MKIIPQLLTLFIALVAAHTYVSAVNRVFVRAEAMDEYLIDRATEGPDRPMTYQIMKGKFRPGDRMDPSMDKVGFEEIVQDLAIQLRKQNLYPLSEPGVSDLLIVVHYGATWPPDLYIEYGDSFSQGGIDTLAWESQNMLDEMSMAERARILGMESYNDFGRWGDEQRLLQHLVSEGRYYVILMAYDFPLLKKGEAKLLWRTRYSIRAIGQSFEVAVKHMNRIASDYAGLNMKGLINKRVDDSSHVSFGEIEVLEDLEFSKSELNYFSISDLESSISEDEGPKEIDASKHSSKK